MDSISQGGQGPFDRTREPGNNDKKGLLGFQIFDNLVIVKTLVGSDNYDLYGGRYFGKERLQEVYGPSSRMGIARAQFSMPEILGDPIETKKGMIRGAPPFLGIVPDPGHFLSAIKDKNGGIQIENYPDWSFQPHYHG